MDKQQLIDALNEDLAGEYQAIITYIQYSASVTGPYREQLAGFFTGEITDELAHAQFLADKVAALGGVPAVQPLPVKQTTDAREMLQNVLDAERQTIERYKQRVELADAFGDVGLRNQLEDMIADETGHAERTQKLLAGW